ncbi:unnamed protein product, partial [Ectocarpus sp. 12 AP-2014]
PSRQRKRRRSLLRPSQRMENFRTQRQGERKREGDGILFPPVCVSLSIGWDFCLRVYARALCGVHTACCREAACCCCQQQQCLSLAKMNFRRNSQIMLELVIFFGPCCI